MPKPAKLKYLGNFDKGAATDTSVRIHHKKPKEKFLKQRDQNYWYIKKASHADIEATVGSFYNLMLNDCAPKSRAVKEISAAEVNFHASKQIHFKRMDASKTEYKEALPAEGPYPERKARPYGAEFRCGQKQAKSLARALVANYIFAENDCHYKNVGIIEETSQICRIDFGQSLWPLLCKYQKTPIMPDQVDRNFYNIKPAEAFPITTRDLINFPLCKGSDAKPLNTIRVIFENTAAKKEFEKQKWKYFLKALLLSQSMFQKIAEQFIENTSVKAEIVRYMTARLQLLENSLLTIPEFNQYIINNIDEFESELFNEFRAYNALKKPSDPVQFDINAVKLKWKQLTANAHAKLVLSSDTYRASKIEMLNQFLVKELERLGSGSHEKTHQIR
ncbi:MAG: hypothetical protein K0S29_1035, partial [Gammaproteobacteria bacterium]|nr:hypothetical protein [Gammaproteobacteria bacterium]